MLTAADELHVHQTPEPIAVAGTDRNFYDRSWFGCWTPDAGLYAAVAFGIYPHLNVADAHLAVMVDGREHCLHASKILHADRTELSVGPLRIEVLEPLRRLRVTVAEHDGMAAELTFEGRAFPVHEPRFTHRMGTRTFMDYTRMSQGARVSGWVAVGGERLELGDDAVGVRDRSWGVRPIGAPDPQPPAPAVEPSFFWTWSPVHFADRTSFFHVCADRRGRPWNTRAVVCPDGASADGHEAGHGRLEAELRPGTRWAQRASVAMRPDRSAEETVYAYEPLARFQMRGLGYFHPEWAHGRLHGELVVEREEIDLGAVDPESPHDWHVQAISRVTATHPDGTSEQGTGLLEQLVLGPYEPYGIGAAPREELRW